MGIRFVSNAEVKRLNTHALSVTIQDKTIYDIADLSVKHALEFFNKLTITDTEKLLRKHC